MEKQVEQCKVYIDDKSEFICIEQERYQDDNAIIFLRPEQINLIIEWLKEAQREIEDAKGR